MKISESTDAVLIEPDTLADASVIWLHGLGADGNDFVPIVPYLGLVLESAIRFINVMSILPTTVATFKRGAAPQTRRDKGRYAGVLANACPRSLRRAPPSRSQAMQREDRASDRNALLKEIQSLARDEQAERSSSTEMLRILNEASKLRLILSMG